LRSEIYPSLSAACAIIYAFFLRYFPEVNLKEEEKVYAAMRGIRGKGKANHNKRAENIMAKQKRKAAFEALRDKNIREQYGFTTPGSEKFSDSSDELLRRPSTSTPTPINGTLDKYAPPWRKAQRQKFLKQQAANQDAASRAPEALKAVARQVYESRRVGRRERAAHLIADLEAQAADGEGPGARAAARHLRCVRGYYYFDWCFSLCFAKACMVFILCIPPPFIYHAAGSRS
jgi:hypothetical protein